MPYDFRAMMELRNQIAQFYATEKPLCVVNGSGSFNVPSGSAQLIMLPPYVGQSTFYFITSL